MGAVFAAMHTHLEERVALKVLLPKAATDESNVRRFLREGKAAVKIRSEHVARILDVGISGSGLPFIVMEHLEGGDLNRQLKARGALPLQEAVDLVCQACEALAEAHAKGIVHRDLKPANLFLVTASDGRPSVKLLDFGISKLMNAPGKAETATSAIIGSPLYMSPEQLRSTRDVDHRTDIWSLGTILFELLTNRMPFLGSSVPEISSAILRDQPLVLTAVIPDAPPALAAAISRCLLKDRNARFATMAEFAAAIAPFGGEASTKSATRASQFVPNLLDSGANLLLPAGLASVSGSYPAPGANVSGSYAAPVPTLPPPSIPVGARSDIAATRANWSTTAATGRFFSRKTIALLIGLMAVLAVGLPLAVWGVVHLRRGQATPSPAPSSVAPVVSSGLTVEPIFAPPPEEPTAVVPGSSSSAHPKPHLTHLPRPKGLASSAVAAPSGTTMSQRYGSD